MSFNICTSDQTNNHNSATYIYSHFRQIDSTKNTDLNRFIDKHQSVNYICFLSHHYANILVATM